MSKQSLQPHPLNICDEPAQGGLGFQKRSYAWRATVEVRPADPGASIGGQPCPLPAPVCGQFVDVGLYGVESLP